MFFIVQNVLHTNKKMFIVEPKNGFYMALLQKEALFFRNVGDMHKKNPISS